VIDDSAVNIFKGAAARPAHARCAPHSVTNAPSLRCLHRLRRPRGCPFESRPNHTATAASHLPSLAAPSGRRVPRTMLFAAAYKRPLTGARRRRSSVHPANPPPAPCFGRAF
jgi:hypothetical protein